MCSSDPSSRPNPGGSGCYWHNSRTARRSIARLPYAGSERLRTVSRPSHFALREGKGAHVQDDPPSSGPDDDGTGELTAEPDGAVTAPAEQLSLMNMQHEQFAAAELLATWKAFVAPLVTNSGAVVDDPELVQLAVNILAVYADHQSRSGLTFAQLREGLRRLGFRRPSAVIEARLEHLHRMGFLDPYLPKLHQGRYIVRPAGLAGALAAARVTERGGVDELILLLDRTRSALQTRHPDPGRVLAHLNSCRHALMV